MEVECTKCGYKFKRPNVPGRCPYCSAEGSVRTMKNAQDFLNEVADIEEDRKDRL